MEEKELKKRELKLEELEKVDGGTYDSKKIQVTIKVVEEDMDRGYSRPVRFFTCSCGFQTTNRNEYRAHMAQNRDHSRIG